MISAILRDSFDLYRRYFVRFVLTAAVVFAVVDFFAAIVQAASRQGNVGSAILIGMVSAVCSVVGSYWVQGALVEAVRDARARVVAGSDVKQPLKDVATLFKRAQPHLVALIVTGLIAGVGVALGMILLVIPGLYLLTRWSLLAPIIMLENKSGTEVLGRSNSLVTGYGWEVFGLVAITMVVRFVVQGLLTTLFGFLPLFLSTWIGSTISQSLVIPFVAIAWTLTYYRLIERKSVAPTVTPTSPEPPLPPMPPSVPPPMPPASPTLQ